jgi:glucosamine 6-phosphate synthetase-like amidotransferase/phosphosugar isomerase protein
MTGQFTPTDRASCDEWCPFESEESAMIPTRTSHPFWMYEELQATPDALERALTPDAAEVAHRDEVAARLAGCTRVYLTGCGTAFHAALAGAGLLRDLGGTSPAALAVEAFELVHYERQGPGPVDALIALSHSGKPAATREALARAQASGAFCLTITGDPTSPAAQAADAVLDEGYAAVKSFAYTISYSLMLGLLADLALRVGAARGSPAALAAEVRRLAALHREALQLDAPIRALAEQLRARERWIFAGAGGNYATALEAGLKMQETNYTAASGMQMEEVLHGPVATLGDAVLVTIAPPGPGRVRALDLLRTTRTLGGVTVALGPAGDPDLPGLADTYLGLPDCPEALSSAPYHVPVHLLSYWLAVARGHNPDLMRRDDPHYLQARQGYTL